MIKKPNYIEIIKRLGLTNIINEVTNIEQLELGFSLIDHYLTTNTEVYSNSDTLPTNASDHFYVYANRKKPKTKHPKSKVRGRAYSRLDETKFKEDIANNNWTNIMESHDCDGVWELFCTQFLEILHRHSPTKVFNTRRDRQPWVCTIYLECQRAQRTPEKS